ncbi:DNA repair/transcription protein MET18/MMS19 [Geosmithia morbida]|uniref:MMS19 nucleotide excision repair protein n=1 Tax=Geosmithia morbida TaxID=1094350 RepID=A0A9P4YWG0_9HYPO|nr:DNA repair/transcription protein MET18/MMS19 [Geosmithia morbida]KAF4122938.1 DNA repair/transcription protein MET18/MMS19 [Geosmithia morbida]
MADFRQLALEFVLADDEAKLTSIAQKAASELQSGSANSNPVARWVEAVQPWMPGASGDEAMTDGDETPDWTGRAKALDFLSRTLHYLDDNILKPSQVKLLVGFFGAMFDIDHKAGILPSATALSRIVAMKAFQPSSADTVIQKVCALRDDFARQISKTRLAVFELLRSLITAPGIASSLQHKYGASAGFMVDLLQLCSNERDPSCLMVWFDIQSFFLRGYSPSTEVIEQVFGTFKAYFPISLPRTSPSGITPEQLKSQLRKCFTASDKLSSMTIPFLLGKIDQGEGVTVNVKVDILKTIKACLEQYDNPTRSVTPYVERLWNSLKYEVRNGEIEDTIWATLEVLKTIATRLKGDDLRDYSLMVTRDCVNDFSNTVYMAAAGRLITSVLSATPVSFLLMVSPAITHIKENLRHPKGPSHSQDLLKLLHVILETRILLVEADMAAQERNDFDAIDQSFKSLYDDVYRNTIELGVKADASEDDLKLATQAVQGAGALVYQKPSIAYASSEERSRGWLLPGDKCSEICDILFSIIIQKVTGENTDIQSQTSDELINKTIEALQRSVTAYPSGFAHLVQRGVDLMHSSWITQGDQAVPMMQTLCPLLAYVGCSGISASPVGGLNNLILVTSSLHRELVSAIDIKASVAVWCALVAGLQSAVRCFSDACKSHDIASDKASWEGDWLPAIEAKYPSLKEPGSSTSTEASKSISEVYGDFLLISLHFSRNLYRKATKTANSYGGSETKALELSDDFNTSDNPAESQYLYLVSTLAGFVFHEMSEGQQLAIGAEAYSLHMFRDDFISVVPGDKTSSWDWATSQRLNILCLGILEALRPAAVSRLFTAGVAQHLIISGISTQHKFASASAASVSRSILAILANKHKIETIETVMAAVDKECDLVVTQKSSNASETLDKATSVVALAAGMLRRYSGKQAQGLLRMLRVSPTLPTIGHHLARRFEMIFAQQKVLSKDGYAIVKPLWMQKMYIELGKPLIAIALGRDSAVTDRVIRTNCSIAVLLTVKHMNYAIYEEDAEDILRIAITVAQTISTGPDVRAAFEGLRNILAEAPAKGEPHLASIVTICVNTFSQKPHAPLDWLPADYFATTDDVLDESRAASGKSALEIMAALPKLFESRHLLPLTARVERELTLACGNAFRELRKSARAARQSWREMQ